MENHPIPQDITGFQFKLVGKMTVRQFIYVGVGVFLAWLVYFVFKLPLYLSLPLALLFSLGGAALAFLPIDGRPMDVMIKNFIASIISPTKYTYEKQGGSAFSPGQTNVASQISQPLPAAQTPQPHMQPPTPLAQAPMVNAEAPIPVPTPIPEDKIEAEEEKIQNEEVALEAEIKTEEAAHQPTTELEEKLSAVMAQKEELEKQLIELKAKLDNAPQPQSDPTPESLPAPQPAPAAATPAPSPAAASSFVSQATHDPAPAMQHPAPTPSPKYSPTLDATPLNSLPDEPNLIKGTVKDARGNPLQNILVEVKDEEDNPVRAFKTNGKGEFASATSLPNGNYTIVLEDPKMVHKFDTSSVEVTGGVVAPLGIVSIDPREELRRELFN